MAHFLLILHVLASLSLIALILLQQGKGAMGAAYGSGASQTLFGSRGATSFLFKLTAAMAAIFFLTSLSLAGMASRQSQGMEAMSISVPQTPQEPAVPET